MKRYYSYNPKNNHYIASGKCQLSQKDGEFLLPANATFIPVPKDIPENKIPCYNKKEKKWDMIDDPAYIKYQKQKELEAEKEKRKEELKKLSQVDEFGVEVYKENNGQIKKLTASELKGAREKAVKIKLSPRYHFLKNVFMEKATYCYVSNNMAGKDKVKLFKDNLEQVWNSIDGTKKPEEIIWPDIPEI